MYKQRTETVKSGSAKGERRMGKYIKKENYEENIKKKKDEGGSDEERERRRTTKKDISEDNG